MMTFNTLIAAIGRKRLATKVGVKDTAISNAIARGGFPASWYAVVADLCDDVGIDCPRDLFAFKSDSSGVSK